MRMNWTQLAKIGPKTAAALLVLLLAVGATGCGGDSEEAAPGADAAAEPLTFVMAVETPPGDTLSNMLTYVAEELETEIGDRIEIERFYSGARGDEAAILEAVRAGQIDMVPVGSDIVSLNPIFGILEVPFLFQTRDQVTAILDGPLGQEMSDSLEESQGLHVLGFGENGFRHITNNVRPIVTPEDLNGLTLRVPGVEQRIQTFEAFGAAPTGLSFDEIYLALDQGVVDGQENPLAIIDQFSFYEVQQYLSLSAHVYTPVTMVINAERWDSLPADVQEAFDTAVARAVQRSREDGIAADAELVASLEENGMEVNEIDIDAFQEAVVPIWESLKADVGADFFDRVTAELQG